MPTSQTPTALPCDGPLRYRVDPVAGRPVAVLPATCPRSHDLSAAGYRARETRGQLRVTCVACVAEGRNGPQWVLETLPEPVIAAELDDAPYAGLTGASGSRPTVSSVGSRRPAPPAPPAAARREVL